MSLSVIFRDSDELPVTVELVPTGAFGFDCDFCGEHSDAMIAVQLTSTGGPAGPDMVEVACTKHLGESFNAEVREVKINN